VNFGDIVEGRIGSEIGAEIDPKSSEKGIALNSFLNSSLARAGGIGS